MTDQSISSFTPHPSPFASDGFEFNEKYLSQIPALQLLINLGFEYLPPERALAQRKKAGNVLLEGILREQLKRLNHIKYKGRQFLFSEENIQTAIQKLKNVKYDGLLKTNEAVYDLITLGIALEQTIEGDSKSFNLNYIDWRNPERNAFHVTAEFNVERSRSNESVRPDIVLFVNGIPLAVIECKSPKVEVEQAISQSIRNQSDDYIPRLLIRRMKKRWGSLSKNGTLTLNADLIRAPKECIDYVVAHELCHLQYHDHSPAFYRLLDRVMPDWKKRKHKLELALV